MVKEIKRDVFLILVPLVFVIDRLTKIFFSNESCFFLFCIHPSKNPGASFGLFSGYNLFLIVVGIAVLVVILYYYFVMNDKINKFVTISLALLFAGTIGNLVDRIFLGYIMDWLTFSFLHFPAFNLADVSNVIGAFMLIIFLLKKEVRK
jgi:signal peptidase II